MTSSSTDVRTLVFDSTNAALWAEEVAGEEGIPAEVAPAPADSHAKCDLSLLVKASRAAELTGALDRAGVPYSLWRPA